MKKKLISGIAILLAVVICVSVPALGKTSSTVETIFSSSTTINSDQDLVVNLKCPKNTIKQATINNDFTPRDELDGIGRISIKEELIVNETKTPLFCTFDSPTEALQNIKNELSELLNLMKNTYHLQNLNESNWGTYLKFLYIFRKDLNDFDIDISQKERLFQDTVVLEAFFDIYENSSVNAKILQLVEKNQEKALSSEETQQLILALPYTSPLIASYNSKHAQTRSIGGFNVSRGVTYAETYAESPNPFYYYFSSDCTNFTSQILEAGGVKQTDTWWHTTNGQTHNHSRTWTVANDFCNYWGISYETIDFNNLSSRVRKGDFIAYDAGNDGDWGHCAFVTAIGSKTSSGYTDFKVAQHSSDYNEWVSSSDNGWEHLGYIPYAIIG